MEYTINAFVDKLLQEKGVTGLPTEVMDQLRNDLATRAEDLINAEILANLPEAALGDFEQKLDAGNDEEIQNFCRTHISNLDELVAGALLKLANIYLAGNLS